MSQLYVISYLLDNRDQILAKISKFDQKKKTNMILYIFIQILRPLLMPLVESVIQKRMISKLGHGTEAVDIGPADDRVSRSLQSSSSAHPPPPPAISNVEL